MTNPRRPVIGQGNTPIRRPGAPGTPGTPGAPGAPGAPGPPGPPGVGHVAAIPIPVLLLGATVDRPVVWPAPFPNANYTVEYLPDASTLGKATLAVKPGTQTPSGCTVTITAGLAIAVAGVCHVVGVTGGGPGPIVVNPRRD